MTVRLFHSVLLGTLLLLLSAASALAEEPASQGETASEPQAEPTTEVVYEQKTVLDFSDVTLEGELARPEGSYLLNRKKARFGSLVELRGDFVPELTKSLDNF